MTRNPQINLIETAIEFIQFLERRIRIPQIKIKRILKLQKKIQPNVDNIFQDLKWHELKSYKLLEYNIKETFTWQKLIW